MQLPTLTDACSELKRTLQPESFIENGTRRRLLQCNTGEHTLSGCSCVQAAPSACFDFHLALNYRR